MQIFQSLLSFSHTTPQASDSRTLSQLFQAETHAIHKEVEQHAFVKQILSGDIEGSHYFQHLVDLHAIYQCLEEGLRSNLKTFPQIQKIYFEELCREENLQRDLDSMANRLGKKELKLSQVANDYVLHLKSLADSKPLLLIAHAYVRYLGDLSGGMILEKHIQKKWQDAVQFYDFNSLLSTHSKKNAWEFKELFKSSMNQIQLSDLQRKELAEETKKAFELSGNLFDAALQTV